MVNAGDMPTGPVVGVSIECIGKDSNALGGIRWFIVSAAPLIIYRQPTAIVSQKMDRDPYLDNLLIVKNKKALQDRQVPAGFGA